MGRPTSVKRDDRLPAPSRAERGALAAITVAFLAVCAFWAVLTPIYTAPDEHAHLSSAMRLTEGLNWPAPGDARLFPEVLDARDEGELDAADRSTFGELERTAQGSGVDQMTQHPPLYYGFGAAVLQALDYEDMRADRVLLALRLAGLIFVIPLPLLVWDATRRLTRRPRAGIVGAAALLAVPQLAQILGSVSNDGLTILLCSTVVWLTVRLMTGDDRARTITALGAALGLALFTKGTALPFVVFTALVLLLWPRTASWGRRLLQAFAALSVAFVIGGWWWARNLLVYGGLQPNGLDSLHETKPWEPGTGPDPVHYFDVFWSNVSVRFWGEFGLLDYPLPEPLTDTLSVLTIVVILGYAYGRHPRQLEVVVLSLLPLVVAVALLVHTWGFYVRTQVIGGLQGRYLYVALLPLIVVSAVAWIRFVRPGHHRRAGIIMLVAAMLLAVWGPFRQYIGAYEDSYYRITGAGLRQWLADSPVGTAGVIVASLTVLGCGVVALVLAIRFMRADPGRRPEPLAAAQPVPE